MEYFSESEIKYLAGLLDADGCLSFSYTDNKLYLEMSLAASESIDRNGYIDTLANRLGRLSIRKYPGTNWSPSHQWRVSSRRDLNLILPRVIKHMVIKGSHWNRMFDKYNTLKGQNIDSDELKEFSNISRKSTGPVKPKNHPTWAWVAGYLDGDGCYIHKKYNGRNTLRVDAVSHKDDRVGLDLLHKAFGGYFKEENNVIRWRHALGSKNKDFAIPFLKKVHKHSRLKTYKIERLLEFHNTSRND